MCNTTEHRATLTNVVRARTLQNARVFANYLGFRISAEVLPRLVASNHVAVALRHNDGARILVPFLGQGLGQRRRHRVNGVARAVGVDAIEPFGVFVAGAKQAETVEDIPKSSAELPAGNFPFRFDDGGHDEEGERRKNGNVRGFDHENKLMKNYDRRASSRLQSQTIAIPSGSHRCNQCDQERGKRNPETGNGNNS